MGRRAGHLDGRDAQGAGSQAFEFSLKTPWKKLPARVQRLLLHGSGDEKVRFEFRTTKGSAFVHAAAFEGVIPNLERRYRETSSEGVRRWIGALMMHDAACPDCTGRRLKPESLAVRIGGRNIARVDRRCRCATPREALGALRFEGAQATIAAPIVKEIGSRGSASSTTSGSAT